MSRATRVPYVNVAGQHQRLKPELLAAISDELEKGQFVLGETVQRFEEAFAKLCGVAYAVAVNSGTDALIIALRSLGIGPGDEVITAPNSFVASASAIALVGARPVFVDVGPDYNMDPSKLNAALTQRTRALLPVHLTGRPANMDPMVSFACRHGLAVVEDAAQAVAAQYRGRPVGSLGTIGCFSLHPLKTLNACGDGGVLTTSDANLAEQFRLYRNLGLKTRENCLVWSSNSRLDSLQAAILLVKLRHLEDWTNGRRVNAAFYRSALANVPGILLPMENVNEFAVYHTFVIRVREREKLRGFLSQRGIDTAIHYPVPIHLQSAAADLHLPRGSFPVAEEQAEQILSLPVYPELTQEQLQWVVDSIRSFYEVELSVTNKPTCAA